MIYNHKKIESKWQEFWAESKIYSPDLDKAKNPFYNLMMFPYPSAEGLHVGNMYAFIHSDAYGRFMRLQGYDVFEPIGLDGFGIHSENYAIKIKEHIRDVSKRTEINFYRQLHMIGNQYDWTRTLETYKKEYYKWTQWLFLKMYEKGLAYRKEAAVNWCPKCKTVLSDEQIIGGACERCESETEKRKMEQWFFKITDYAERLLKNLETNDWSEEVKTIQKNWIGRSEGATIQFSIVNDQLLMTGRNIEVYTTRPDTLFGCTFLAICPEHPLVHSLKEIEQAKNKKGAHNWLEIKKYIETVKSKTDLERTDLNKDKSGIEIKGIQAVNPINGEKLPIYIVDYVLSNYGTGAIMAVPAHDERDFEFALKYQLPIKNVVAPFFTDIEGKDALKAEMPTVRRKTVYVFLKHWNEDKYLCLDWEKFDWHSGIIGGIEENETAIEAAQREIIEETGYQNPRFVKIIGESIHSYFFAHHKQINRYADGIGMLFQLQDDTWKAPKEEELINHKTVWIEDFKMGNFLNLKNFQYMWEVLKNNRECFTGDGVLINSGQFSDLKSKEAHEKIIAWLEEKKIGARKINFRLRDWCVSRQRYWGPPIPMIYCEDCGWLAVSEKDLPVELPDVDDFLPDGSGKGPLNKVSSFVNTVCPKCNQPAKRETDVSDPFVDSSWYFLRYPCCDSNDQALNKNRLAKWLPIDMYIGGKEHSVLHLLYCRFVTMVMYDLGYIDQEEPFKKFRAHGLLVKDGAKISKSKGNLINPDDYIRQYGADTVRFYLMFMGDFRQGGDWRDSGVSGMYRFVKKIYSFLEKIKPSQHLANPSEFDIFNRLMHKTIRGVKEDFEKLKFNTAISKLMILANRIQEIGCTKKDLGSLVIMIAPFAPHLAEEIWFELAKTPNEEHDQYEYAKSVFKQVWPVYDSEIARDELLELVVQINSKVRAKIEVSPDIQEQEAKKIAQADPTISKWLEGKEIIKTIFVPGRLINIVIK